MCNSLAMNVGSVYPMKLWALQKRGALFYLNDIINMTDGKKETPWRTKGFLSGLLTHFFNNPKSSACFGRFAP